MKRGWQDVAINAPATSTYLLSGWAMAESAANTEQTLTEPENNKKRYFGLIARCDYTDGTKEYFYMPFNDDYTGWQYATCVIAPKKENQSKTISNIRVITAYDYNINGAAFDDISLRKEPCTTYTYDSKGNLTAVNATGNSAADFTYAAGTNKLTKSKSQESGTYEYSYGDSRNDHLVTKIKNDGVSMNITYDDMGNSTRSELKADSGGASIVSTATYSADGSQLMSQTNGNGYTTTYTYENRRLKSTTDNAGNRTATWYNDSNGRPHLVYRTGIVGTYYGYENGMVTSLERVGYIPGVAERQSMTYNMGFDGFGNMTSVAVGDRTLATYDYGAGNGNLASMTYGNGTTVSYSYDALDRVTEEYWDGVLRYRYFYSAEGDLAKKLDVTTGQALNYEYDSLGRLIHSRAAECKRRGPADRASL